MLVEGQRIGWAASGRNGGFCSASLTHGASNGARHFPDELDVLEELGQVNLDAIEDDVAQHGIACDFSRAGALSVATEPYQVAGLRDEPGEFLDAAAVRAEVNSPTYLAGVWDRRGTALLNPAALAWGLARAAEDAGVRVYEHTPARSLRRAGGALLVTTPHGTITARQAALGHQRVPQPAAPGPAAHCPGLRLRPGHRAAVRRAARQPGLAARPGHQRPGQPVPLLPADR